MAKIVIDDDLYEAFSRQCEVDGMSARGVAHHLIRYYLGDSIVLNIHSHQPRDSQNLPTYPSAPQERLGKTPITTPSIETSKSRGRPPNPKKPKPISESRQAQQIGTTLRELTEEERAQLRSHLALPANLRSYAVYADENMNFYDDAGTPIDPRTGTITDWAGNPPSWVHLPPGVQRPEIWHPPGHDVDKDPFEQATRQVTRQAPAPVKK